MALSPRSLPQQALQRGAATGQAQSPPTKQRWTGCHHPGRHWLNMGWGAHPALHRPPGSPGMSHTVGPVGAAPWACTHQWLLAGPSQMPAAATGAPDQSHCVFTKEQLEPEPPWVQPSWPRGLRYQPARGHLRLPSSAHCVLAPAEAHSERQAMSTYTCMGGDLCAWKRGVSIHVSRDDYSQVLRRARRVRS